MKLIDIEDEMLLKNLFEGGRSAKQVTKLFMKQPTVKAIPIEWLERWSDSMTANAYSWNETGYQVIHSVIEDWRKENDTN